MAKTPAQLRSDARRLRAQASRLDRQHAQSRYDDLIARAAALEGQAHSIDTAPARAEAARQRNIRQLRSDIAKAYDFANRAGTDRYNGIRAEDYRTEAARLESELSRLTNTTNTTTAPTAGPTRDDPNATQTTAAPVIDPAHNHDQARYLQTVLKNAGYYHGAIDGVWGPQSMAANTAYQAAQTRNGDTQVAPTAEGAGGASGGVAVPSATSAPSTSATPAATSVPASGALSPTDRDQVLKQYPDKAWMLEDPELAGLLHRGMAEGWTPEQMQAQLVSTEWFKVHGTASIVNQLRDESARFGVRYSDPVLTDLATQLATGQKQPGEFRQQLEQQASAMFGADVGDAIKRGIDPRTYIDPYVQRAAKLLEVNPAQIDWTDAKWLRAIQNVDPKTGQKAVMSLSDWESLLRTDPSYGYDRTQQARDAASQFAMQLAQKFGKVTT